MTVQKLLIVDDSPEIHEQIRVWLEGEPLEFASCHEAREVLAIALRLRPDLILLDVELGKIDGLEVFRRLKADPATAEIPVVLVVDAAGNDQKHRGLELGATDYLAKPLDSTEVRARVRAALHTRKLADLLARMERRGQVRADVLEMIAQGQPLRSILCRLIEAAQDEEPDGVAAAVVLPDLNLHLSPRLPDNVSRAIAANLATIVPRLSELGAKSRDHIASCDLADPAWGGVATLLAEHEINSSWAIPIFGSQQEIRGAFVIYLRTARTPDIPAIEMLKFAGELTGIAGRHRQLTEMLTFQAHHDVLTQLPNRVLFNDRLQQALALAARTERPLAVLLVDIDRFKSVNDTYGHQIGDEVLCQVANRLRNRLRLSDTLARMGGDEFAVVLCHLSHSYDTEIVARALVEEFRSPIRIQGRDISVTVTVGAAIFPRHGSDAVTLLKNADLAMYRGKERGRNSALAFTPEMGEEIIARLEMENSLRHALPNGELRLFYQPKVTPTGKIRGLEALLRWQHPKLGLVTPSEFFALAEETGVILPIGAWVLHEAARQHRAWLAAGLPAISIAVNVSTLQFAQSDFIQTVQSALALCESAQAWLEIELTESLLMKNMRNAAEKLELLRRMNVTVAIDDFGTGYSSLAYLQRLPLDTLKINHIFFDSMQSEHGGITGQPIAGAIVSLAKSLGLEVVAEGVETEAQCDYMVEVGCDLLQGYLFSTPLDPEQIEPLLRAGFIRRSPALTHSV